MINNGLNVRDEYKTKTVPELQAISKRDRAPFSVLLFNLEHDLNIGNVIRSAHLLGATRVIVLGNRKIDRRACVGSQNYIDIIDKRVNNALEEELVVTFKEMMTWYNMHPLGIDNTETSRPLSEMTSFVKSLSNQHHPCLVFGNESLGIPPTIMEIIETCSNTYHINQRGVIRSFNVASAAAIVMYEVLKAFEE